MPPRTAPCQPFFSAFGTSVHPSTHTVRGTFTIHNQYLSLLRSGSPRIVSRGATDIGSKLDVIPAPVLYKP